MDKNIISRKNARSLPYEHRQVRWFFWLSLVLSLSALFACSTTPYPTVTVVRENPGRDINLQPGWNDTDMKLAAEKLVDSVLSYLGQQKKMMPKPVIMVGTVSNRTMDHIDVHSLTDKITTALLKTGQVEVVDETAREELKKEYTYQQSGVVSSQTKKGPGQQIGENYLLRGEIASDVQKGGREKVIYYKITLQLTDVETNLEVWKDDYEIKKIAQY